jgi:invasion protein IalB
MPWIQPLAAGLATGLIVATSTLAAGGLPGGASSLTESYGDWAVACTTADEGAAKVGCAISQQQATQQGERFLSIELHLDADSAQGILILPFGLNVGAGVRFQVDDGAPTERPFRTCLPVGCVVELRLDAATLDAFRAGKAFDVVAQADKGGDATFAISLKGVADALARTLVLQSN